MIRMKVLAKVRPEKRDEFIDAIHFLRKHRLMEQGISGSQFYVHKEVSTRFLLVDEWETVEDLQRYFGKEAYRILLGALRTLCTDAEVKYDLQRREGAGELTGYTALTQHE